MRTIITFITAALMFTSCEKVVDLNLDENETKLVVEGNITNLTGPYYVKLSRSVSFTESNNYPAVTSALVIISDNAGQKDTLTHIGSGRYQTHQLQGVEGRQYLLTIQVEGKSYSAESKMPRLVNLDSLRLSYYVFNAEDQVNVIPVYNDPDTPGNNYRFIQTINGKRDNTYFTFNDNLNNGLINQRPLRSDDPDLELKPGDVVRVEMQCIPLSAYTYFYSLGQQEGGGPGGGTTPANPPNNISGGALGLFSAHTMQVKSVLIP